MNTQSTLHPQLTVVNSTKMHLELSNHLTPLQNQVWYNKYSAQYLNLYYKIEFKTVTAERGRVIAICVYLPLSCSCVILQQTNYNYRPLSVHNSTHSNSATSLPFHTYIPFHCHSCSSYVNKRVSFQIWFTVLVKKWCKCFGFVRLKA